MWLLSSTCTAPFASAKIASKDIASLAGWCNPGFCRLSKLVSFNKTCHLSRHSVHSAESRTLSKTSGFVLPTRCKASCFKVNRILAHDNAINFFVSYQDNIPVNNDFGLCSVHFKTLTPRFCDKTYHTCNSHVPVFVALCSHTLKMANNRAAINILLKTLDDFLSASSWFNCSGCLYSTVYSLALSI